MQVGSFEQEVGLLYAACLTCSPDRRPPALETDTAWQRSILAMKALG